MRFLVVVLCLLIAGCGPSEPKKEEIWEHLLTRNRATISGTIECSGGAVEAVRTEARDQGWEYDQAWSGPEPESCIFTVQQLDPGVRVSLWDKERFLQQWEKIR